MNDEVHPGEVGVMILPGVTLFPHALLPLYIFEQRYRDMLAKALSGERMFAIAHAGEDGEVAAIGGLGIVRACVANEDGTSNLILQGLSRVVFTGFRMKPFPMAAVATLTDLADRTPESIRLLKEVGEACRQIRLAGVEAPRGFDQYLSQIEDPGAFADVVSATFVSDPVERRGLLEERDVEVRLDRLLRCLLRQLQAL